MLGAKIAGCPHGQPFTVRVETGQRNGVGKNRVECVKMSMLTCSPQAHISQIGLRHRPQ